MAALNKPVKLDPETIVIFRALQLGDMLNTVPAFRALRAAFPTARITLVGLPWAQTFVERFHGFLDAFLRFPGYPGLPEQSPDLEAMPGFIRTVQSAKFDLALQMQGSGQVANHIISFWGARRYAGFYPRGEHMPDREHFLEYPEDEPERWRHLRLMEFLGVPLKGDALEFPLRSQDWRELQQLKDDMQLGSSYVCIHPGARKPERRWPVERFAAVADGLSALGYRVLLTGSPDEAPLTTAVAGQMSAPAVNLAGKTTLGGFAALLAGTRLLVSNDTGVSHVAAAVRAPSLILFSAQDHDRWSPANQELHKTIQNAMGVDADEVLDRARAHLDEMTAGRSVESAELIQKRESLHSGAES